ncbi:MAG: hypothetical protein GC165_00310 [Armatimonadetes bacterium]|nr:hypothetical protein [Armatimonadota bacterium]
MSSQPKWTAKLSLALTKAIIKLAQGDRLGGLLEASGIGAERLDAWVKDKATISLRTEILTAAADNLSEYEFPDQVLLEVSYCFDRGFTYAELLQGLDHPEQVADVIMARGAMNESQWSSELAYIRILLTEIVRQIIDRVDRFPGFFRWLLQITKSSVDPQEFEARITAYNFGKQARADAEFEEIYCQAFCQKFNEVQLFIEQKPGPTRNVTPEDNRLELSVAYVTLQLGSDGEVIDAQNVLSLPKSGPARKYIKGMAGSGKSTLLAWFGLQSQLNRRPETPGAGGQISNWIATARSKVEGDTGVWWTGYVPFFVRLRDCSSGTFPTKAELTNRILSDTPPDSNWAQRVFDSGRALLLVDGLDELPIAERKKAMDWFRNYTSDRRNIIVISSRPQAVDDQVPEGFDEFEICELTPVTQDLFLDRWHEAVARKLELDEIERANLEVVKGILHAELQNKPELARLARNPLLCALLCAINRVYRGNLPTSLDDLCESAVTMLLWDRDFLQLGSCDPAPKAYRDLDRVEKRREIIEKIAFDFIEHRTEVRSRKVVSHTIRSLYGRRTEEEAEGILQGIIERSNLLRAVGADDVEFVHNTLRDYLGAHPIAEVGDPEFLTQLLYGRGKNGPDPINRWEPLFTFIVASRSESDFALEVLRALISMNMDTKGQKAACDLLALRLAKLYRRTLPVDIEDAVAKVESRYLPVNTKAKAVIMGQIGPSAVRHLLYEPIQKHIVQMAKARALSRISTGEAVLACRPYVESAQSPVEINEIAKAVGLLVFGVFRNILEIPLVVEELTRGDRPSSLDKIASAITSLDPLLSYPLLESLNLAGCPLFDYSGLSSFTNCQFLDLSDSNVSSIEWIRSLKQLKCITLSGTKITDIDAIGDLTNLNELCLRSLPLEDISPLARLENVKILDLSFCPIYDLSHLRNYRKLEHLMLIDCGNLEIDSLPVLPNLITLELNGINLSNFRFLNRLPRLREMSADSVYDSRIKYLHPQIRFKNRIFRLKEFVLSSSSGLHW